MPLNNRALRTVVFQRAEPVLRREVRRLAELDFNTKKEQLLEAFDQHPVTREIKEGPDAPSNIPQLAATEGNLYSFLGFDASENPTEDLYQYLDENIKLGKTGRAMATGDRITYKTEINIPTVTEVDEAMAREVPLEWTGRSFTEMISKGIPGLPNYLFRLSPKLNSSRSGTAVQTQGKALRGGSFGGVPYIGELLAYFKRLVVSPRTRG